MHQPTFALGGRTYAAISMGFFGSMPGKSHALFSRTVLSRFFRASTATSSTNTWRLLALAFGFLISLPNPRARRTLSLPFWSSSSRSLVANAKSSPAEVHFLQFRGCFRVTVLLLGFDEISYEDLQC